jgi:hypothetical protein
MNIRSLTPTSSLLLTALACAYANPGFAQKAIDAGSGSNVVYRCPNNEYTNDPTTAKAKNCSIVPPNISTVEGPFKPAQEKLRNSEGKSNGNGKTESVKSERSEKGNSPEQKARDSDRRKILEDELKSSENKLADLKKEYNNGEPDRRGDERNYAKYQERVAQMKADITRAEADVSALKREIGNLKD